VCFGVWKEIQEREKRTERRPQGVRKKGEKVEVTLTTPWGVLRGGSKRKVIKKNRSVGEPGERSRT